MESTSNHKLVADSNIAARERANMIRYKSYDELMIDCSRVPSQSIAAALLGLWHSKLKSDQRITNASFQRDACIRNNKVGNSVGLYVIINLLWLTTILANAV